MPATLIIDNRKITATNDDQLNKEREKKKRLKKKQRSVYNWRIPELAEESIKLIIFSKNSTILHSNAVSLVSSFIISSMVCSCSTSTINVVCLLHCHHHRHRLATDCRFHRHCSQLTFSPRKSKTDEPNIESPMLNG